MKILIAYYSRTGTTKKVSEALAEKIGAETEEIRDNVDRSGAMGYMASGRDAMKRKVIELEPGKFNPADFDLVIVGTPVWSWNISVPVRSYLNWQKNNLKKVAFFCTMGGSGDERTFSEMEKIINQKPAATMSARTIDVVKNNYLPKLEKFVGEIKSL
jgi:flavodoxin